MYFLQNSTGIALSCALSTRERAERRSKEMKRLKQSVHISYNCFMLDAVTKMAVCARSIMWTVGD